MKKRNPLAVFFLSIITLGIYDLYWLYQSKKVLNQKTSHHTPSIWLLIVPVPVIIIGYILLFTSGHVTTTSNTTSTYTFSNTATTTHSGSVALPLALIVLGFLASFVISIIWFYKFSKAVNEYTQGKMSTAVAFLVLWLIHLIGVALIQDSFNDMGDNMPYGQPMPPVAPVAGNFTPPPQQVATIQPTVSPTTPPVPPTQVVVSPAPQPNQQPPQNNGPISS